MPSKTVRFVPKRQGTTHAGLFIGVNRGSGLSAVAVAYLRPEQWYMQQSIGTQRVCFVTVHKLRGLPNAIEAGHDWLQDGCASLLFERWQTMV